MKRSFVSSCLSAALVAAFPLALLAASPASRKDESPAKTVEMFAGIDAGEVEVVMIMKDSKEGTVMVKNKTDKPLTVKIPAAFAGVPILAQRGGGGLGGAGGGMGGMGGGGGGGGGGMQGMMGGGMGGGMGGMGGGMMGGGMGGGMFNVAPDKVQKIKITTVCADHGLDDPNPRVPYKPIPIDSYAKDPAVVNVVKLMLAGRIDQHSAQAATWHIQNGLSWEELAKKVGYQHRNGRKDPYFRPMHLERALMATRVAQEMVEKDGKDGASSLGEQLARPLE
jgi:hypothetical protein